MTKGLEIRAQIDTETARGLIQINGGGAVAIVALLPSILKEPAYAAMAPALFLAVPCFACGLLMALIHNMFRRKCSLVHDQHEYRPPGGKFLGFQLTRPGVCIASNAFLWASVVAFVAAIVIASIGVYRAVG